ncbi:GIY-YIG nuclease family protein [Chryseobacterium arthrosphaerae]|uniref:GIY-YIG nuclease family protein n=1 Tax=Chryseobacterium arthrosphaerae TaxID=651561 RepID=UPI0035E3FC8B
MIDFSKGRYTYYIYILTNKNRTVLYTGVTGNLHRRLYQHKTKLNPNSFTARYNLEFLIYYENMIGYIMPLKEKRRLRTGQDSKSLNL